MAAIGQEVPRVDGPAKVTGSATYSADARPAQLAFAALLGSRIAKGRILAIDDDAARASAGVLAVITSRNRPPMALPDPPPDSAGQRRLPLQDDQIDHLGQPVAVVVAESREAAEAALALLVVSYAPADATLQPAEHMQSVSVTADGHNFAWATANDAATGDVTIEAVYTTPFEHHNPIEPAATTAMWVGDELQIFDATQWLTGVQKMLSTVLQLPAAKIRVVSRFVGGSFGAKRLTWPHVLLAAIASRLVGRPVKLALTRRQMFTMNGHRPQTEQKVRLTAHADGQLTAFEHNAITTTSANDDFVEPATAKTRMIYSCPSGKVSRKLIKLDLPTPTTMRAPGEATGFFAVESAMDELAARLGMDPLALRLKNYAERDPVSGKAWSSKSLKLCYTAASEKFGWAARKAEPRSMRDETGLLVGWGVASAAYPVNRSAASARIALDGAGQVRVQSGTHEMGAGTYTALAQIAADAIGATVDRIQVELGDTQLPRTTVSGGSRTLASVGSAVLAAGKTLRNKLIAAATAATGSPLHGVPAGKIDLADNRVFLREAPGTSMTFADVMAASGQASLDATANAAPVSTQAPMLSFGAHFIEVKVDPALPVPRVTRVVSAFAAGHIVNPLIARSQLMGGIVGGIGMALLEQTVVDPKIGGFLNTSLAGYLVPTSADIPAIEVLLIDETDLSANPLGTKGVGELGIVGAAAAVTNAVYHATGVRGRALPIRIDELLGAEGVAP
ncbi:xanthine dehydrogenase family protein molybdopterin-binding subunit [Bradyrhizobium sp. LA6.12]|uniref:xanthine dehydrogenase family protein molybdopterin-binding subunit n=1 Tax=unclassified Bradyrhizobium TaxID=2631580 RepID=UPI003390826E